MPERAPLHGDIADGPERGSAYWTLAADGVRIRVGVWDTGGRGLVLILPGRTEYVEKYGPAAARFAEDGYSTAVIDWRGQGLADRLTGNPLVGHVRMFGDYQKDLTAAFGLLKEVGAAGGGTADPPVHLVAHSMGGAIGLAGLIRGVDVASVVFSAPMWGILLSPALRLTERILGTAARTLGRDEGFAPGRDKDKAYPEAVQFPENLLTGHEPTYLWMRKQLDAHPELKVAGPSWRWVAEALGECRYLAGIPPPNVPCLTILGMDEAIVDPDPVRAIMKRWPEGELLEFSGCGHEPMMESPAIRGRVFEEMLDHFGRHRPH